MRRALPLAVTMVIAMTAAPRLGAAQTCGGDCDGNGIVTVNEVITAVNIVLGSAPLAACAASVPAGGTPGVSHLIAAVSNALCACAPCPPPATKTPTRTPTATPRPPTATATITQTPTPTPVVSTWLEDNFRLSGSTCPKQVNDAIRSQLGGQSGTYRISEREDGTAVVEDGAGNVDVVTVDEDGVLHTTTTDSDSQGSCTVVVDAAIAVPLRMTPSTATYRYNVNSSGCARNVHCRLTIMSRWTRTDVSP